MSNAALTEADESEWVNPDADRLVEWHAKRRSYVVRDPNGGLLNDGTLDGWGLPAIRTFDNWADAYMAALEMLGFPDVQPPHQA